MSLFVRTFIVLLNSVWLLTQFVLAPFYMPLAMAFSFFRVSEEIDDDYDGGGAFSFASSFASVYLSATGIVTWYGALANIAFLRHGAGDEVSAVNARRDAAIARLQAEAVAAEAVAAADEVL